MTIHFTNGATATLYMFPGACSQVTMTALEEAKVEYVERMVDLPNYEQKSDAFLEINPKGKVPALQIGGRLVTENAAILWLLHRAYPDAKLLPTGRDGFDEDQGLIDLIWCTGTLHPIIRQIRAPHRYTGGDTSGVYEDGMTKFTRESRLLDERLADSRWWYGDAWSIVDTYLYWIGSIAQLGGFPLQECAGLLAHAERVRARPSFQRATQRETAVAAAK